MSDKEKKADQKPEEIKDDAADAAADLSKEAQKVLDMVEKMSVLELSKLVKALEEKFGVSASAPVAMAVMGNGNGAEAEEKSEYDVVLESVGDNKISVIKAVRSLNQELGLQEAKALVESAPKTVLEAAPVEKAKEAQKVLEEAGAKVSLK